MICPHCQSEIAEGNFCCPKCHERLPVTHKGSGHATQGTFEENPVKPRNYLSGEDAFMLGEPKGDIAMEDEGFLPAQPLSETKFDRQNNK